LPETRFIPNVWKGSKNEPARGRGARIAVSALRRGDAR
jgi:hypothetical protein